MSERRLLSRDPFLGMRGSRGWGISPWEREMFDRPFMSALDMEFPRMALAPSGVQREIAPRDFGLERQVSEVTNDNAKFAVKLDVSQYKPDELEVTTKGNEVIITGKHEERQDEHGFVSRQFQRRYLVPDGAEVEKLVSNLGKDGFLSIEAPKPGNDGARRIPIGHM